MICDCTRKHGYCFFETKLPLILMRIMSVFKIISGSICYGIHLVDIPTSRTSTLTQSNQMIKNVDFSFPPKKFA